MGGVPRWYALLRAAKYLGCAPWELANEQPMWMNLALAAEGAEARAQEERAKHQKRKRK
jgi:hypothetical protein